MTLIFKWLKMVLNCKIIKDAGHAYCLRCYHDYTYEEYSKLPHRQHYPQYKAYVTVCQGCRGEKWRFLG
jgi:hypothetical protein